MDSAERRTSGPDADAEAPDEGGGASGGAPDEGFFFAAEGESAGEEAEGRGPGQEETAPPAERGAEDEPRQRARPAPRRGASLEDELEADLAAAEVSDVGGLDFDSGEGFAEASAIEREEVEALEYPEGGEPE